MRRLAHSKTLAGCATLALAISGFTVVRLTAQSNGLAFLNGNRPIVDAHNCYPYEGKWTNRIDRALSAGFPVAIEQDLAWAGDAQSGHPVISHTTKTTGDETTLDKYFFERIRPIVESELQKKDHSAWPVVILHLDFKELRPELLHGVWAVLNQHRNWLTTAVKSANPREVTPFEAGPVLVLTEDADEQEKVFYGEVPVGQSLLLFGSVHTQTVPAPNASRAKFVATAPPDQLMQEKAGNYRRWWNNAWGAIEEGGPPKAGVWTAAAERRLKEFVDLAHQRGLWIRFYTLDGFTPQEDQGWGASYNFGSAQAARIRWQAALKAGVNFIATDQYEALAKQMQGAGPF